jgi:hypothetical protein
MGSRDVAQYSFQHCFKLCEGISEEIGDYVARDLIHKLEPMKISEWPQPIAAEVCDDEVESRTRQPGQSYTKRRAIRS